jgi:gamma-glutamylcyclotransferase (GGCT)/AIG2-like uncharacterized protein YtfP
LAFGTSRQTGHSRDEINGRNFHVPLFIYGSLHKYKERNSRDEINGRNFHVPLFIYGSLHKYKERNSRDEINENMITLKMG